MNLPKEFESRMKEFLGDEYKDFAYCYENDNYQALRINTLKVSDDRKKSVLDEFSCSKSVPWAEDGYYYEPEQRPGKHPYHEMGLYYIQEPSAMSAAAMLSPKPGLRILDLCAAPGGKSTQLASYLSQEGLLVANEINAARAKILSLNIERMGIKNAIVTNEESGRLALRFPAFFHGILVDAPCSGEGMFRKNPEAIEEWSPQNVANCALRQSEILDNAATMLLPGGTLVYSTCTFAKEENEDTIVSFLDRHPEFELMDYDAPWFEGARDNLKGAYRLWPHKLHGEGHFAAILKKSGVLDLEDAHTKESKEKNKALSKDKQKLLEEFVNGALDAKMANEIIGGKLSCFGEQLYLLPKGAPSLNGIRVLRSGLHIGEFKKNRFEPSHALALALNSSQVKSSVSVELEDPRCLAYFRGEAINISDLGNVKGWTLMCINDFSAGWGKANAGTLKNHYPKGLRKDLKCDTMCKVKSDDSV